ncbi:hypothetical protein BDV28DRAFT_135286 [Aspergillus coremiiformis]|uniref:Uncharacterized protein n=1 Tax=Aspergillus coremiiformis TaxID=138285 RepID=A0A5N6Z607_9EURO|nr:hypothetical protein BDV28DRAFT_135286 [Aspergillus coremiiformis]
MSDSDRKRPQSDDPQPSPPSDALSSSRGAGTHSTPNDKLRDEDDERCIFSLVLRDTVKNARISAEQDESDSDDYTSSSGSDSEEDDDNDNDNDDNHEHDVKSDNGSDHSIPHLPARQKPQIHRIEKNPDLVSRLSAFLPQMKNANDELQREIEAGRAKDLRLDEVDDQIDGQYIEMNLGLGVLEERRPADNVVSSTKNDGSDEGPAPSHRESHPNAPPESDVLETLMGNKDSTSLKKPTIEEMNE